MSDPEIYMCYSAAETVSIISASIGSEGWMFSADSVDSSGADESLAAFFANGLRKAVTNLSIAHMQVKTPAQIRGFLSINVKIITAPPSRNIRISIILKMPIRQSKGSK